jgi:hypothetical protein
VKSGADAPVGTLELSPMPYLYHAGRMPRAGRRFEQLIAELEKLLARTEVIVRSPDYIPGRKSGSRREVDVSVRGRFGSVEMLVVLECRDRNREDDVTWIEQLASKRDEVGADLLIAVSSSGFSEGARRLADAHGVLLRGTEPLRADEVFEWLPLQLEVHDRKVEIKAVKVGIASDGRTGRPTGLPDDVVAALQRGDVNEAFLRRKPDSAPASLSDVWSSDNRAAAYESIEPNSEPVRRSVTLNFPNPDERFQIETGEGWEDIESMIIDGDLRIHGYEIPISRLYTYNDSDGTLTENAEVEIDHEGTRLTLSFHRDSVTGEIGIVAYSDGDVRFNWRAEWRLQDPPSD